MKYIFRTQRNYDSIVLTCIKQKIILIKSTRNLFKKKVNIRGQILIRWLSEGRPILQNDAASVMSLILKFVRNSP